LDVFFISDGSEFEDTLEVSVEFSRVAARLGPKPGEGAVDVVQSALCVVPLKRKGTYMVETRKKLYQKGDIRSFKTN